MKKQTVWILVLVLLVTCAAFAWTEESSVSEVYVSGDFEYIKLGDTVKISRYSGSAETLDVPAELDGKRVVAIGDRAFFDCRSLKSVMIPGVVDTIGDSAFQLCIYLNQVLISDGVSSIGNSAFLSCYNLCTVAIPDSVTFIGNAAFRNCECLTSVILPNGLTSVGDNVFKGCRRLESILVPDSVTVIGNSAFESCVSLKAITIPYGVTSVGKSAFGGCKSLSSIFIPDGLKSIGDFAFQNCSGLNSVIFPDGVTRIGGYSFSGCTNLKSVSIPDTVRSIGDEAFSHCKKLRSLLIPEGVTAIGDRILFDCDDLRSVVFPGSAKSVGERSFAFCRNLKAVVIGDGVTTIGGWAFGSCESLCRITIPDSVTSIEKGAFSGCTRFALIEPPKEITSVGDRLFDDYKSLTAIVGHDSYAEEYCKETGIRYFYANEHASESEYTDPVADLLVKVEKNLVTIDWSDVALPEDEKGESLRLVYVDTANDYLNSYPAVRDKRILRIPLAPGRVYIVGFISSTESSSPLPEYYKEVVIPPAKKLTAHNFCPLMTAVAEMPADAKDGQEPELVTEVTEELLKGGRAYLYVSTTYEVSEKLPKEPLLVTLTDPDGNIFSYATPWTYDPGIMKKDVCYIPLTGTELTEYLDRKGYPKGEYQLAYYVNGDLGDMVTFELR